MKFNNILESVGDTPHVRVNRLLGEQHEVWLKLERANPGGSIKDRIALAMIEAAEAAGVINQESVIIEPTSGNTGIALAMVAAVKGYRVVLVMPESMSVERRRYMQALGAELVLTPKELGMGGAIEKANELLKESSNGWIPQQFDNPANVEAHRATTAQEILRDFPDGLDYLFAGVGTGGHISGCAEVLKVHFPEMKVIAVEPLASPVISGGVKGPHPIQGIGAGFIPGNLCEELLDSVVTVDNQSAFTMTARCAREEGIFVGLSSGASLAAIASSLPDIPAGSRILAFSYDTGERYLSVDGLSGLRR